MHLSFENESRAPIFFCSSETCLPVKQHKTAVEYEGKNLPSFNVLHLYLNHNLNTHKPHSHMRFRSLRRRVFSALPPIALLRLSPRPAAPWPRWAPSPFRPRQSVQKYQETHNQASITSPHDTTHPAQDSSQPDHPTASPAFTDNQACQKA